MEQCFKVINEDSPILRALRLFDKVNGETGTLDLDFDEVSACSNDCDIFIEKEYERQKEGGIPNFLHSSMYIRLEPRGEGVGIEGSFIVKFDSESEEEQEQLPLFPEKEDDNNEKD